MLCYREGGGEKGREGRGNISTGAIGLHTLQHRDECPQPSLTLFAHKTCPSLPPQTKKEGFDGYLEVGEAISSSKSGEGGDGLVRDI